MTTAIGPGTRVTLHFSLLLEDGEEIDTTRRGEPATFAVGDESLPPGFEAVLFGLSAGQEDRFTIAPQDGFGESKEDNLRLIPRDQFDMDLEEGLVVSFAAPGGELPGVVKSLQGDLVVVDFNHPLAGKTLVFDVSVLAVEVV